MEKNAEARCPSTLNEQLGNLSRSLDCHLTKWTALSPGNIPILFEYWGRTGLGTVWRFACFGPMSAGLTSCWINIRKNRSQRRKFSRTVSFARLSGTQRAIFHTISELPLGMDRIT